MRAGWGVEVRTSTRSDCAALALTRSIAWMLPMRFFWAAIRFSRFSAIISLSSSCLSFSSRAVASRKP